MAKEELDEVRTDMHCHACSKGFIALIDMRLNGKHVIECAHCGHEHCRVVQDGKITEDRWDSRWENNETIYRPRRVWKNTVLQVYSSSASEFIRQSWLNRWSQ